MKGGKGRERRGRNEGQMCRRKKGRKEERRGRRKGGSLGIIVEKREIKIEKKEAEQSTQLGSLVSALTLP